MRNIPGTLVLCRVVAGGTLIAGSPRRGTNVLRLVVPAGPMNNGVVDDYLRLELNERTNLE